MGVGTKRQNGKKASTRGVKNSTIYRPLLVCAISICAIIFMICISHYKDTLDRLSEMTQYLNNKYGQEFVVKNYRIEGSGLGVEGDPTADAYPKNDPTLKFRIWDYGDVKKRTHLFGDDYLGERWEREYSEEIKEELYSILNKKIEYEVTIGINSSVSHNVKYKDNIPSFSEYKSKNNKKDLLLELVIFDYEAMNDRGKLWGVLVLLKNEEIDNSSLRICNKGYKDCFNFDKDAVESFNNKSDVDKYFNKMREVGRWQN